MASVAQEALVKKEMEKTKKKGEGQKTLTAIGPKKNHAFYAPNSNDPRPNLIGPKRQNRKQQSSYAVRRSFSEGDPVKRRVSDTNALISTIILRDMPQESTEHEIRSIFSNVLEASFENPISTSNEDQRERQTKFEVDKIYADIGNCWYVV